MKARDRWALNSGIALGLLMLATIAAGDNVQGQPELTREVISVPGKIARLELGKCGLSGQAVITNRSGQHFRLLREAKQTRLVELSLCPSSPGTPPAGMLLDGELRQGEQDIAQAWLAGATDRYDHGILGDRIEAEALRVITRDGQELVYTLDQDSVFEDRFPRVVDLEGDGSSELLVVVTRLNAGASAALFGIRKGQLALLAESEPIGIPHRWLAPVGAADFDGDGSPEIAAVVTPHIGGRLTLYQRRGRLLQVEHQRYGFSNHFIGSRELGMSAYTDLNGDQVPDLILPAADRKSLKIVTFAGGHFKELSSVDLNSQIATAILAIPLQINSANILFGLTDGNLLSLTAKY